MNDPNASESPLPSPPRASAETLRRQIRLVAESPIVSAVLEVTDAAALLVVNLQRQIVAANLRRFPGTDPASLLGTRPGDALRCRNARSAPGGCGTAAACRDCGALGTILASQRQRRAVEGECLLTAELETPVPLELAVRATPLEIDGVPLTVVSLQDVGPQKRREALERVFLHDLANTLGGLGGWARALIRIPGGAKAAHAAGRLLALVEQLEREIRDQRALLEAETGTLQPAPERIDGAQMLERVRAALETQPCARERRIGLGPAEGPRVTTDPFLLQRVLANMVKNALEATPAGGQVRAWCEPSDEPGFALVFRVHNAQAMPPEVAAAVFQRSFSTKASRGRGLGSYSMKLLGERYLQGRLRFTSSRADGTCFEIHLPGEPGTRH